MTPRGVNRVRLQGIEAHSLRVWKGLEQPSFFARGVEATEGSEKCQNARKGPETKGFGGISIHGALTVSGAASYLFKLVSKRSTTMNRAGRNEADIQAAQPQAGQQARVPGAHENGRRSQDAEPTPEARPGTAGRQDRRQVSPTGADRVEALPRGARIRLGSDIRNLLKRGERKRTRHLDVFFDLSPVPHSRLGLIVPKHGHTIVERNLVKRRLREIGRREALPRLGGSRMPTDVLLRARLTSYDAEYSVLEAEVMTAVEAWCSGEF